MLERNGFGEMRSRENSPGTSRDSSSADVTIGRADPVTGLRPDIDLTAEDVNRFISRRHARILQKDGTYYLVEEVGLPRDKTRAVSYGEDTGRLVAAGAEGPGVRGWENRRVVLVIDHHGEAPAATTVAGSSD